MYISKAMLNMRGDVLGSTVNGSVDLPWMPYTISSFGSAVIQGGGSHISADMAGAIVFSTGDTIPDSIWDTQTGALFSITSLRTYLTANLPACVMDAAPVSIGNVRIVNVGEGKRMFELNNQLGRFAYAKAFNRMYLLLGSTVTTIAAATNTIASVVEFTPQDLISMGAPLVDNGDGTFNLTGTVVLNNISFS